MPHLDHKGPDGQGSASGRGLGHCHEHNHNWPMGKGMGLRRRTIKPGDGMGKRLKSGKIFDN